METSKLQHKQVKHQIIGTAIQILERRKKLK